MEVYSERIVQEACTNSCVNISNNKVIDIDVSDWLEVMSIPFLERCTLNFNAVRLTIKNCPNLDLNTCNIISEAFGRKITEIYIDGCHHLTWSNEIKKLLSSTKLVEVLILKNNKWVDDFTMEQIAIRFQKTLTHLEIENSSISNNALHHIGRRCSLLRYLNLTCCPKISDTGILELSKKIQLRYINISHNMKITDDATVALLSNIKSPESVIFVNCPKLTDRSVAAVYEYVASWGTKRNLESQTITHLELRDNANFTSQILIYVSACLPHLTSLDLRDCADIDIIKGMNEMYSVQGITELKLGPPPTRYNIDSGKFLQSMLYQAPKLVKLHLVGLRSVTDEHIGVVIENALELQELKLVDMNFGLQTIESIISNVPNIATLQLTGSNHFLDLHLQYLTRICYNIVDLTIQRCPNITDDGFTGFVSLRKLQRLNLADISLNNTTISNAGTKSGNRNRKDLPNATSISNSNRNFGLNYCTGKALLMLTLAPIRYLVLDGLVGLHPISESLRSLPLATYTQLEHLSFQRCPDLQLSDVEYLLNNYVGCRTLDCTGCGALLSPDKMATSPHYNPFLSYDYTTEFSGYRLNTSGISASSNNKLGMNPQSKFVRYWAVQRQLKRHYGAKLMQQLRRKYLARLENLKQERRDKWASFKSNQTARIQSVVRGFLTRRRVWLQIVEFRRAMQIIKEKALLEEQERDQAAYRHYLKNIALLSLHKLRKNKVTSRKALKGFVSQVIKRKKQHTIRRTFAILKEQEVQFRELSYELSAGVFREEYLQRLILTHWRTVIFETYSQNQKLVNCFLLCVHNKTLNSLRHQQLSTLAMHFHSRRVLTSAWLVLAKDLLEIRRVNALLPYAIDHANQNFFRRVVGAAYGALLIHRNIRLRKKYAVRRAMEQYLTYRKRVGCLMMWQRMLFRQTAKSLVLRASHQQVKFVIKQTFRVRFRKFVRHTKHFRKQFHKARDHRLHVLFEDGFHRLVSQVVHFKKYRVMNKIAETKRNNTLNRRIYNAWCEYKTYSKNIGALYYQRYLTKLCKKIMHALQKNVAGSKAYARIVQQDIFRRTRDPTVFLRFVVGMTLLQARLRGKIKLKRYQETRVLKLWAIQLMQNFARTFLARLAYSRRRRKEDIAERAREDFELDMMREIEAEMMYYYYKITAIIGIQRVYRGWKDRLVAAELAIAKHRDLSADYYSKNQHLRLRHEAFKRAALARENLRHKAAAELQKRVRGMQARKRYIGMRLVAKMERYAVYVQREYRRRLAQLKLQGMKRDKKSAIRFQAARKQRGYMLRLFGVKKRESQAKVGRHLADWGVDPLSFNYSFKDLVAETIADFRELKTIILRERELFREHGFPSVPRLIGRRKILDSLGWRLHIQDAVKIAEVGHKYAGYTGAVSRIDETLLGAPLFEVRLDRFPVQTFVRMTTDALYRYLDHQPLQKIESKPLLSEYVPRVPIFGLNKDQPFFSKRNIKAAWTIQRTYRAYRGRKMAAKRRYELWIQSSARQWSMVNHMAETNTLSAQGNTIAGMLRVKPHKPVFFDEIRHAFLPARLMSNAAKPLEKKVIAGEFAQKREDRIKYLQKCAFMRGKDQLQQFSLGMERMTWNRKIRMFASIAFGLVRKGGSDIRDFQGTRGMKFLAKQQSMVTGLDKYCFDQFEGSPHVRYYKTSIYQGEWSGIPLFTPLKPHGEGVIVFLDGWGFAREDKVLYITILRCINICPMDLTSSDPYCEINCNTVRLRTTVRWKTLNPEYNESFEIDVTNPCATLNISVKDKDFLGNDDFMGQIIMNLSDIADAKDHVMTLPLKGEDPESKEAEDRGEIVFKVRWAERKYENDQAMEAVNYQKLLQLQRWARRIAGLMVLKRLRKERIELMKLVREKAVKITSTCRIRLARKELKRRTRFYRNATKLQKRVRIWIARRVFKSKKLRHLKTIIIQARIRVYLAKALVDRMKKKNTADLDATVTFIQKHVRKMVVRCANIRRIKEEEKRAEEAEAANEESENDDDGDNTVGDDGSSVNEGGLGGDNGSTDEGRNRSLFRRKRRIPVSRWIHTYGVDAEYGLKRNRRITLRLFQQMLRMPFVRLLTRFGVVYIESYPPKRTEEEMLLEMQMLQDGVEINNDEGKLTNRKDFVSAYLPPFNPLAVHRKQAVEQCSQTSHTVVLHLPTSVAMRESVEYNISTIQCFIRQRRARAEYRKRLRVHKAIALFQRRFRKRYEVFHKAANMISSLFRLAFAKKHTSLVRKERNAALRLQMAYRCYTARTVAFDLRSVEKLSVLKSQPESVPLHGPERCLEHREDTFWIAESHKKAEIRVEFAASVENIIAVWIMTSTYSASPSFVTISAVLLHEKKYTIVVNRTELPLLKQHRWHKFILPNLIAAKYFKVLFEENYGDQHNIAIRQIRFLRSPEISATIIKQPRQFVLENGPMVGEEGSITLKCEAIGWPAPSFQWFKGNSIITGATQSELTIALSCDTYGERAYRCTRCKMVSMSVPLNAYHIKCGNCSKLFAYKDVEHYDKLIMKVQADEEVLQRDKLSMTASRVQLESFQNVKYLPVIADLNARIDIVENKLQILRESRIKIKENVEYCNKFYNEGIYYCQIQNIRGGSMKIKKKSAGSVVFVEHSRPYVVPVSPVYIPRVMSVRRKWNVYSSLHGTFRQGRIEGLVVIRYNDNSYYEGPYIPEEAIDLMGHTLPAARAKNHYGVYKLPDGRIFEGVNVDNHFDRNDLNTYYRLVLPDNKGTYEGQFCDEQFHGIGMFTYEDKSVYEGGWFRGTRFGHGHYRSAEGWAYEGFYDTSRRHRNGVISWPDGSCYLGEWFYDDITGKGIYITPLRDVYKGSLVKGKFEGQGELIYADGSRYLGQFQGGLRHGKGIFTEREGNEYYGNYIEDRRQGEHVVKLIIPIEEAGQDNYEIRIGQYDQGNLVKWKSKFSNPIATKQFINLFKRNRDMFDSVFSLMLAKNLPALPDGIDANNEHVKAIVYKIRNEAGMLVGEHALNQAQAHLKEVLKPVQDKNAEIDALKAEIETLSLTQIAMDKESMSHYYKFTNLVSQYEKDTQKIEQYWIDEPTEVRHVFQLACKALETLSIDDYFSFRNHRIVPTFVAKIFDAISCLLDYSFEWKQQQYIVADSVANSRNGDEEALRLNYKCKLIHLMKNYKVYDHVHYANKDRLAVILADARFHRDSYYIQSTGIVGPILVDWIKSNYNYIRAATHMYSVLHNAEEKLVVAYRSKATHLKKKEEVTEVVKRIEGLQAQLATAQDDIQDLQHALLKANDLLQFITGRFSTEHEEARQDYYKLLEMKMELKRDLFTVEVCVQSIVDGVVHNIEKEKQQRIRELLANGQKWIEPPPLQSPQIKDLIRDEVKGQQSTIIANGNTLGYSFESAVTDVSKKYTLQLVTLIVDILTGKLNDIYNDRAEAKEWISMKGRILTCRFLYIHTWRCWEEEAHEIRDQNAVIAWETIFATPDACARMALESKVSDRMSSIAREQAKVWAQKHPEEMRLAELQLADGFQLQASMIMEEEAAESAAIAAAEAAAALSAATPKTKGKGSGSISVNKGSGSISINKGSGSISAGSSNIKGSILAAASSSSPAVGKTEEPPIKDPIISATARHALSVSLSDDPSISPDVRAACACWMRLHPEEMNIVRDALHKSNAERFQEHFSEADVGEVCYKILNGWAKPDEMMWIEYAEHWKSFNMLAYNAAGEALVKEMAEDFADKFGVNTYMEAAKIIENDAIAKYILDEEVKAQYTAEPQVILNANCWAVLNQGMLRKGKNALRTEQQATLFRQWNDFAMLTENFQKGSTLLNYVEDSSNSHQQQPHVDRFAGFRLRLANKFAWMYGYLCHQQQVTLKQIADLSLSDPIEKILHRIRPSELHQVKRGREDDYMAEQKRLEAVCESLLGKIATWNTYFGIVDAEQQQYDNYYPS